MLIQFFQFFGGYSFPFCVENMPKHFVPTFLLYFVIRSVSFPSLRSVFRNRALGSDFFYRRLLLGHSLGCSSQSKDSLVSRVSSMTENLIASLMTATKVFLSSLLVGSSAMFGL